MSQKRKRGPNFPAEVIATAIRLADNGKSQSEIQRELAQRFPGEHQPHLNTVKLWIAGRRNRAGERWSIAAFPYTSSADPALVIPVLGALVAQGSAVRYFTVQEAEVLTRVREARPDWPEVRAWHMTRDLVLAHGEVDKPETRDVEQLEQLHLLLALPDDDYRTVQERGYFSGMVAGSAFAEPDNRAAAGSAAMGAATPGVS